MNPSSSSHSASSFSDPLPMYDLFLNYSDDIRDGFISHVKGAFIRNGFSICDHPKLIEGQEVSPELLKAIDESEIIVLVFSIKYAISVKCLNELVNIMDIKNKFNQKKVFVVFFNVDPRDVRKQEGPFKEAFEAHTTNFSERVQKWRQALKKAGQLSDAHYKNGDEESFVREIVEKLQNMRNPPEQRVIDHPVGIEYQVEEIISSLRLDSEDVSIVAILGVSGIGKTTIANAVYNNITANFDASCFLEVVSYSSKIKMQKDLISSISQNDKLPRIHNHFEGIATIRKLTIGRKVILVLDDVTDFEQLETLGIYSHKSLDKCFGDGSRIIVTTRHKQSLGNLSYVSYNTRLLNIADSIELFIQLTNTKDKPIDTQLVNEIAYCSSGLPLVLKLWSRHFGTLEREEWPNALKLLKTIPLHDVQKKLKFSYDSLTDNTTKKLVLDIACFFDGMDKELIIKVLQDEDEHSAFFWDQKIRFLADKCLVIISSECHSRVLMHHAMHHAIREMGQEIIRQENEDPGQRTRLTNHKDVLHVLKEFSGTQLVESIRQGSMTGHIDAFRKMNNLRLIRLSGVPLCTVPGNPLGCDCEGMAPLSFPKLKYLEWRYCPMKSINIDMCNVVVVLLQSSKIRTLWKGYKRLKKLKILDVCQSPFLIKTDSFIGLENLEHLHFRHCYRLEELDSSVCYLDKLVTLDLRYCCRLKRFPLELIGKLRSLEVLDLTCCLSIGFEHDEIIKLFLSSFRESHITGLTLQDCKIYKLPSEVGSLKWLKYLNVSSNRFHSLPDSLGKLDHLETLDLGFCEFLTTLPSSMSELTSLKELNLRFCHKLGIEDPECLMKLTGLTSLTILDMEKCNVSKVPSEIGNLVSLRTLNLEGGTFSSLPNSFNNLLQLRDLSIRNCSKLTSLPLLPSLLTNINATRCVSLDVMRSASVVIYDFCRCTTPSLYMTYPYKFSKRVLAAYKEASFLSRLQIALSEDDVPIWCHVFGIKQAKFMAPRHLNRKICGMILCLRKSDMSEYLDAKLHNKTKGTSYRLTTYDKTRSSTLCIMFIPVDNTTLMVDAGDWLLLEFPDDNDYCLRFGVCLIYKDDEMEPSTNHAQTTHSNGIPNVPDDELYNLLNRDYPYNHYGYEKRSSGWENKIDYSDSDKDILGIQKRGADYHPFFEAYHAGFIDKNIY